MVHRDVRWPAIPVGDLLLQAVAACSIIFNPQLMAANYGWQGDYHRIVGVAFYNDIFYNDIFYNDIDAGGLRRELLTARPCITNICTFMIPGAMDAALSRVIGCLLVTHLPVKAVLLRQPELAGQPVIIASSEPNRRVVVDAAAEARGVRAGQTLSEALSRCGDGLVLNVDETYLGSFNAALLAGLLDVADRVEPVGYGLFYLDLTGMDAMYGGTPGLAGALLSAGRSSLQPRLGMAGGKFPAFCAAASTGPGDWFMAPADAARWLAPWPVSWLPLARDATARLSGFGISTLGDLAALPSDALADFLGPEGLRVWHLARGIDDDPVHPTAPPETRSESLEFPFPVDTTMGLEAGIRALCERLWRPAAMQGRCVSNFSIEGELLAGGAWRYERPLIRPACSDDALAKITLSALGARDTQGGGRWPAGPLLDLTLTVSGLSEESGHQSVLWPERYRTQLAEIDAVERLIALDRDSALPERRWALGSSLKPVSVAAAASVQCQGDAPAVVQVGSRPRPVEQVVDLWEVDTGWWTPEPVHRRYWKLALSDGGLVTVYHDLRRGGWFRQDY